MNKKQLESVVEWLLLALVIGTVMGFGAIRMHQLALNQFLVLSYAMIAALLIAYRFIYRKFIKPAQPHKDTTTEE